MLRLEAKSKESGPPPSLIHSDGLDFRVLFYLESPELGALSWNWRETILRPAPGTIAAHDASSPGGGLPDRTRHQSQAIEMTPIASGSRNLHPAIDLELNELCTQLSVHPFSGREAGQIKLGGNSDDRVLHIKITDSLDAEPTPRPISLHELLSTGDSL